MCYVYAMYMLCTYVLCICYVYAMYVCAMYMLCTYVLCICYVCMYLTLDCLCTYVCVYVSVCVNTVLKYSPSERSYSLNLMVVVRPTYSQSALTTANLPGSMVVM